MSYVRTRQQNNIVERCVETGNVCVQGDEETCCEGEVKCDLITHALHVKAVVFGVAYSFLGFSFASYEARETPLWPLPCWQAVCWHAQLVRFTKREQIVGIKQDDNVCSGADLPQFNTCQDAMRLTCQN